MVEALDNLKTMKKEEKEENIIVSEDLDDSVVMEEHTGEQVKKLKEKLKEAETKAKEYLDGWQRSQADFANLRRRDEEARLQFLKFAAESFVVELLPVLDSFDLAIKHDNSELEPVRKQFLSVLKSYGLEESEPVGENFDPRLHESVGAIKTNKEKEDHKVFEVIQKGYILSGKIIRPAKVKIGEYHD